MGSLRTLKKDRVTQPNPIPFLRLSGAHLPQFQHGYKGLSFQIQYDNYPAALTIVFTVKDNGKYSTWGGWVKQQPKRILCASYFDPGPLITLVAEPSLFTTKNHDMLFREIQAEIDANPYEWKKIAKFPGCWFIDNGTGDVTSHDKEQHYCTDDLTRWWKTLKDL
jgi:hypothetical protein